MVGWEASFPRLEQGEVDLLEVYLWEEEIWQELMSANGTKTLGPDGFTFKFTQVF